MQRQSPAAVMHELVVLSLLQPPSVFSFSSARYLFSRKEKKKTLKISFWLWHLSRFQSGFQISPARDRGYNVTFMENSVVFQLYELKQIIVVAEFEVFPGFIVCLPLAQYFITVRFNLIQLPNELVKTCKTVQEFLMVMVGKVDNGNEREEDFRGKSSPF